MTTRKKLIEVALPLKDINTAAAREKSIRHGHPSTLHLWWARRPLAAARAVIFAQMVDDPSSVPDEFPTEEAQNAERERLFDLIRELVVWENTTNERVLEAARAEIRRSWARWCKESGEDPNKLPAFHDPFAGGGALPLEAQRLGLEAYASDLNPVAVLINKAMIEIPPKFAGKPPVHPGGQASRLPFADGTSAFPGARGLAEDVRYYGQWMRDEAQKRIGHLYPTVAAVRQKDGTYRHATESEIGNPKSKIQNLTVIAWLWARTVESPNPAYRGCQVPLISSFWLSTKKGKETWIEPVIDGKEYRFKVRTGMARDKAAIDAGTKLARGANFRCLLSDSPMSGEHIKAEGMAGRMGARLMAIVAEGERGRVYLPPTLDHEQTATQAKPTWEPDGQLVQDARAFTPILYGVTNWHDLFTSRQLVALTTFSDLMESARMEIKIAALAAGWSDDGVGLGAGGTGATAYADAVSVYLAFALDKMADLGNSFVRWEPIAQCPRQLFGRQAIPMVWDYAEANSLSSSSGGWEVLLDGIYKSFVKAFESTPAWFRGHAEQFDAATQGISKEKVISTDPPYYDNVPYADLSDFFYVWLRCSLKPVFPELFATLAVPKAEELVVTSYRHGGKKQAEAFFMDGMTRAMHLLAEQANSAFPVSIYYAFKQAENESAGMSSTGWETFLEAVLQADFAITGTWPMRTENSSRLRGMDSNALATSIILVCRPRPANATLTTRRDFLAALKRELPIALRHLQRGNIAPVDLAQASLGPGMAVFTRYAKVLESDGTPMRVRTALQLINQTLDEALAEQENEFDPDTRWALAWFEQFGFNDGPYGDAETLSKAKNTAVNGLVLAGVVQAKAGKVRLLRVDELSAGWNPATDKRLTAWETVHHLIRTLNVGEAAAAQLAAQLGGQAEVARDLAYRLYMLCERKKRAAEALAYNGLVQSWPEITRLARERGASKPQQTDLL